MNTNNINLFLTIQYFIYMLVNRMNRKEYLSNNIFFHNYSYFFINVRFLMEKVGNFNSETHFREESLEHHIEFVI